MEPHFVCGTHNLSEHTLLSLAVQIRVIMSALKLCKRSKGLDTGNKDEALTHTSKHAVCINIEVQDVSLFLAMFKESICAGDTDVALWELGHLRVCQNFLVKTTAKVPPLRLTCITTVHIGVTQSYSMLAIPFVCGGQVTLEAAMTDLSIHSSQEESLNGHAKKGHSCIPSNTFTTVRFSLSVRICFVFR